MNEGDVNDLHIRGCAAIALLCPVTGNTDIQKDKMGRRSNKTGQAKIYTACR